MKGSGKTHLTKLFVLDALREVEQNPHAKLIVYEPKRQFYAWLSSLGLSNPVHYFMPSDKRSVALDFMRDYPSDQDSKTLAHAFYPLDPNEKQRFWGDALRTIYAGLMDAIKAKIGRFDLRLMCLAIEEEAYARSLLDFDEYLIQARKLIEDHGDAVGETKQNIQMTIHSRIAEMKVLAAHQEQARKERKPFSLRDFVQKEGSGTLVISKDATYGLVQDPMNGVLFNRLVQLLDAEQVDRRRKVFIVIDEFPTLAGDAPCPGIRDMFLRLRDRGVVVLIAYQAHSTLKRVYGEQAAEIIGQCSNVIYLSQADVESAGYAASDLGVERKHEWVPSKSIGPNGFSVNKTKQWSERHFYADTELLDLPLANRTDGVQGRARSKCSGLKARRWPFHYEPSLIDRIPRTAFNIPEYEKRDTELKEDAKEYFERIKLTQRLEPFTDDEKEALGLAGITPTRKAKKRGPPPYPPEMPDAAKPV